MASLTSEDSKTLGYNSDGSGGYKNKADCLSTSALEMETWWTDIRNKHQGSAKSDDQGDSSDDDLPKVKLKAPPPSPSLTESMSSGEQRQHHTESNYHINYLEEVCLSEIASAYTIVQVKRKVPPSSPPAVPPPPPSPSVIVSWPKGGQWQHHHINYLEEDGLSEIISAYPTEVMQKAPPPSLETSDNSSPSHPDSPESVTFEENVCLPLNNNLDEYLVSESSDHSLKTTSRPSLSSDNSLDSFPERECINEKCGSRLETNNNKDIDQNPEDALVAELEKWNFNPVPASNIRTDHEASAVSSSLFSASCPSSSDGFNEAETRGGSPRGMFLPTPSFRQILDKLEEIQMKENDRKLKKHKKRIARLKKRLEEKATEKRMLREQKFRELEKAKRKRYMSEWYVYFEVYAESETDVEKEKEMRKESVKKRLKSERKRSQRREKQRRLNEKQARLKARLKKITKPI